MLWHIVRFDFEGVEPSVRTELEERIASLADLDIVAWLRVARDVDLPNVSGLISGFRSHADLEHYRTHPDHLPIVEALRQAGVEMTRVDLETGDDPASLP